MANEFVRNLLMEQRKRVVGSIMGYVEREIGPALNEKQRRDLREKVLGSVGVYHDTCLDILKASVDDGIVPNAELLEILGDIHTDVKKALDGQG